MTSRMYVALWLECSLYYVPMMVFSNVIHLPTEFFTSAPGGCSSVVRVLSFSFITITMMVVF